MKSRGWRLLVVSTVGVTALALSPLSAAAQEAFALTAVRDGATPETATWWVQQVRAHEPGQSDAAAKLALSLLNARMLGGILDAVHRGRLMINRGEVESVLARGAILHTDIAVAEMRGTELPDRATTGGAASLHFGMATEIVAVLKSRLSSEPFAHRWHVAVAAVLASHQEVNVAPAFLERALDGFPNDPDLLLLAGAARELRASPRVQDADDLGDTRGRVGSAKDNLRRAEDFYRRAANSAPNQVEARVRLGHVLCLTGRHREALAELDAAEQARAAVVQAGGFVDQPVLYFLALFAGEAEEGLNQLDSARQAYARASALYPNAGSAWLDLSRLELRGGSRDAALAAVVRMSQPATREDADDPWRKYPSAGPARRVNETLAALAAAIPRRQ
jgi:tetratricopeptide (TPR) repeat protein